jgi:hypothetical protein
MWMDGSSLDSHNNLGLWAETDLNALHLIARAGDPAPEAGNGVVFSTVSRTFSDGIPVGLRAIENPIGFNDHGEVAFLAHLAGPGIDISNDTGIWAMDSQKILHLVAQTGRLFDVGGGDFRQIAGLYPADFNNAGQLVFGASFTDGSTGVFFADVNAIPEPSSLVLAVGGMIFSFCGSRKPRNARVTRHKYRA